MKCRHCARELEDVFVDLATAPPSNAYVAADRIGGPETYYPLRVLVCRNCWLVQTEDHVDEEELFSQDYAYFSSYSQSWVNHAGRYAEGMIERFGLGPDSKVAEVASNDGYLLQFFRDAGIRCYGIEPTARTAAAARAKGIEVLELFFGADLGARLAADGRKVDLVAANNVLAHVPDINDFSAGFARLLKPAGVATFEFPHLLRLVEFTQFDTIYHEHFSYLSLGTVSRIFEGSGLHVFDVEELDTHGGSLRVFAQRAGGPHLRTAAVETLLDRENDAGMGSIEYYRRFQPQVNQIKDRFVRYLLDAKAAGLTVAAYGAAAKGNTLLNYAGVRGDLIAYVVDRNPHKQAQFLPGSRIPIVGEDRLREDRPDRILILPWNLSQEIAAQLAYTAEWGAKCVRVLPEIEEL